MEILRKFWNYLTFKKDTNPNTNSYLKTMHGINKLSIAMFIIALVILAYKCIR